MSSRLFTFKNYSGDPGGGVWPPVSNSWVFLLGLLLPIYTITGYDASAHTSEETLKAARSVPRAMVMSVVWSAIFGYLFLCAFVLMIPNMDEAAKQGWNVFFWGFDERVSPGVKQIVYLVVFRCAASLRAGDSDLGLAHDLRVCSRRWPAGLDGTLEGQPEIPHARRGDLDRSGALRAVRVGHLAGLHRRNLGLHHRGFLHGHLPVPLLHRPDHARPTRMGNAEVGQDGAVGHGPRRSTRCSRCSRSSR